MKRPEDFSKSQLKYVEHLESKVEAFSSKKTIVKSYFALKKTIDDINEILTNGMTVSVPVLDPESEEVEYKEKTVAVVSSDALSSKDEKTIDRLFKFIDKLGFYNLELKEMSEQISPEDMDDEDYASEYEEAQKLLEGND